MFGNKLTCKRHAPEPNSYLNNWSSESCPTYGVYSQLASVVKFVLGGPNQRISSVFFTEESLS